MERVGLVLVSVGLAQALVACGGVSRSPSPEEPGMGGGASAGGATSSAGTSAGAGTSSADAGAGGDTAGGGAPSGGSRPADPQAGASGGGAPEALACDEMTGDPRADGPELIIGVCDAIPDAVLLDRYESYAARVPRGFFYDAKPWRGLWLEPCAHSPEETAAEGGAIGLVGPPTTFTTPWFYEASFCGLGPRESVRNLRCDYFDGATLADATRENLVFLASIRWWAENQDRPGAILGYSVTVGTATDWVDLCTLSGTTGGAGQCDQLRLERQPLSVRVDGEAHLGKPELVRTVQGACH